MCVCVCLLVCVCREVLHMHMEHAHMCTHARLAWYNRSDKAVAETKHR